MKQEGNKGYNYVLELVDAESKTPFLEHSTPDGTKTFAEVEPETEYLVRVDVRDGNCSCVKLIAELSIDGRVIRKGKKMWKSSDNGLYLGFRSYFDGIRTETSLKFDKIATASNTAASLSEDSVNDMIRSPVGEVRVAFYEAVKKKVRRSKIGGRMPPDTAEAWAGQNVAVRSSGSGKKKLLKTISGGTITGVKAVHLAQPGMYIYCKGKLVESIHINYSTAQGLIHAGIWPSTNTSNSQGQDDVIDLTDAEPPAKKAKSDSGVVDLTNEWGKYERV
uniref:Uncharacterized protein n=1 Tax=Minutocellus polymorphus TaxID=265543 RepID=A0A7S0FQE3_9STRA|mmetsp:Transcript_4225/g.7216  ORF Transcript_4225/g.7216 Transcript_4225/m.7216 type:complete len:277 (+) Transcript_4225:115-945(+)